MKRTVLAAFVVCVIVICGGLAQTPVGAQSESSPIYISPGPGTTLVSPGESIALRFNETVDRGTVSGALFQVEGAQSGTHAGRAVLADDQRTVVFSPQTPFTLSEEVSVVLRTGLRSTGGQNLVSSPFTFQIKPRSIAVPASVLSDEGAPPPPSAAPVPASPAASTFLSNDVTLPTDFPTYTVDVPANGAADGYVFLAATAFQKPNVHTYLVIMGNDGQPSYYRGLAPGAYATDFKRQPNGLLTYYDSSVGYYTALDSSYNPVATYHAGNGIPAADTDLHDLQVLPNGHALLLIYDAESIDMSAFGGNPNATVIGLIVQEIDTQQNVVFQWRSWDHFQFTDSTEPITGTIVDYVHGNAIEQDQDGNLLLSSRHLDEVTKIDRNNGNIIWRLGGKNNQFTFAGGAQSFAHQHDIRRLPNGNITLWDNRNGLAPQYSRGVEYQLDEVNKIATQVWEYRNAPDTYSPAMGNTQRLANGNTMLGWGLSFATTFIEAKPDGFKAFQLSLAAPMISYRSLRFTWTGSPNTSPTLVASNQGVSTTLSYSWNGETEVASYHVYGGNTFVPSQLIATQPRTGFEDRTVLTNAAQQYCAARVVPVDRNGQEMRSSNIVYFNESACTGFRLFLPMAVR